MKITKIVLLALTLGGAFWLGSIAHDNAAVQNLIVSGGYIGIFIFSIINGFNVIVPIVTASFIPALTTAGLNLYALIIVIALGMSIADCVAYFVSRAGHVHLTGMGLRIERFLETEEKKRHSLPLWVLALWSFIVPLPNELVVVPLGLLGYPPRHVLPITLIGNLGFVALIGLGFVDLFSMLGI